MQVSASRWGAVYTLSQFHSVVALQEVPSRPPAGAVTTGRRNGNVVEYRWRQGSRARGGTDAASLVARARNRATASGWDWAVLGDFNRDPPSLARPPGTLLDNAGQATQQSGGELNYLVSNVETDNWQATVAVNQGSDHWPVYFGSASTTTTTA